MRAWRHAGALAVLSILATGVAQAAPVAERAIRDSLDRLAQAWNTPDGSAWAAEYWSEGELINILGVVLAGAREVGERSAAILAGPFRGTHFSYRVRRIRFIGTQVAIVDTDISVSGFRGLPGIAATSPGELRTRMKHVYERRQEKWRIVASQNTAVVASPAQP